MMKNTTRFRALCNKYRLSSGEVAFIFNVQQSQVDGWCSSGPGEDVHGRMVERVLSLKENDFEIEIATHVGVMARHIFLGCCRDRSMYFQLVLDILTKTIRKNIELKAKVMLLCSSLYLGIDPESLVVGNKQLFPRYLDEHHN